MPVPHPDHDLPAGTSTTRPRGRRFAHWSWGIAEWLGIVCVMFLVAGSAPPDVNEAHYLGKARHAWDPTWCAGDVFLESADAHFGFFTVFGWLTLYLPLPAVAWIGRTLVWSSLAAALLRLSRTLTRRPGAALLISSLFLMILQHGHMAGEWVVGGVEAKGMAWALVFWALADLVRGRWQWVWLWLGAASAVHVLVGGWSVVAALVLRARRLRSDPVTVAEFGSLCAGGMFSLVGLVPAVKLGWGIAPAIGQQAHLIYVDYRLGHHLSLRQMAAGRIAAFGVVVVLTGTLVAIEGRRHPRWRRLAGFAVVSLVIWSLGAAIDLLLPARRATVAGWLRFYWFRLADVAMPLALATGVGTWLVARRRGTDRFRTCILGLAIVVVSGLIMNTFWEHRRDPRPGALRQSAPRKRAGLRRARRRSTDWVELCGWIRRHTPPDAMFLTPRGQQTFKWYAQRAEVVAWKDIPQDPQGIVEWHRRMTTIYPPPVIRQGLGVWSEAQLQRLARTYGFDYVVIDRGRTRRRLRWRRLYPYPSERWPSFEVYQVPRPDEPDDVPGRPAE